MDEQDISVACSLTSAELQERRRTILSKVRDSVLETVELESGFAYRFPPDSAIISQLATLVELERQCCPFLRFRITVEEADGPIWLELTGPEGTKELLASLFN
jgi:hypothetical protein